MARHANTVPLNLRSSHMTSEHARHPVPFAKVGEKEKHEALRAAVTAAETSLDRLVCPNGCGELESWYGDARCCAGCGFTWKVVVDTTVHPREG